jgi:hypothetical protein
MTSLFVFVYGFFLFLFALGALFILYHLLRYSLNKTLGFMGAILFSVIFCILLVANIGAFVAIDTKDFIKNIDRELLVPESQFTPPTSHRQKNPW